MSVTDWNRSWLHWSQGEFGFYVNRHWNAARKAWVENKLAPIKWDDRQAEAFEYLFTLTEDLLPLHSFVVWADSAQSAKTHMLASLGQWTGMYHGRDADVKLTANSREQAGGRAYRVLLDSLRRNPYASQFIEFGKAETRFVETNNILRAIPKMAGTQSGGPGVFTGVDEFWDYSGEKDRLFLDEMKLTPAQGFSLMVLTSYPPYADTDSLMNEAIDSFLDNDEQPREGVHKVDGLEHLPLWVNDTGGALWWNHEGYPWYHRVMPSGLTFLEEQRANPLMTEGGYLRMWEARRVQRVDIFLPLEAWDRCEDKEHTRLSVDDRGEAMCIGMDIGIKGASSALVARGYENLTQRYPLLDHLILPPQDEAEMFRRLFEWIVDKHRHHHVLAVYYDPFQAVKLAADLREEGVNMVEWTQNTRRDESDTAYRLAIIQGLLRNYTSCGDLRNHVGRAVGKETRSGGIRMDKRMTNETIDGAIADSGACLAVAEHRDQFLALQRRRRYRSSLATSVRPINPYAALYPSRRTR